MNTETKALVEELVKALVDVSKRLEEKTCTCLPSSGGHENICSGTTYTEEYKALVEKARNLLKAKLTITRFPMEYKGWKIEIKMGHEFKGIRGSVKKKRGYVATRLSDGMVSMFAPSYDTTPSLQSVKIMIDAEERGAALYSK